MPCGRVNHGSAFVNTGGEQMKVLNRVMAVCGALLLVSPCSIGSPAARADGATAGSGPAPRRVGGYPERDFTVAGTPVQGSTKQEDAPLLAPGQYTDVSTVASRGKSEKYYKVRRTWQGSTLRINVLGRMSVTDQGGSAGRGDWDYELTTADGGASCSRYNDLALDTGNMGIVVGRTMLALPLDPKASQSTADVEACGKADEFLVKVGRGAGIGGETQVEIRVLEEPPVENIDQLPAGVQKVPKNNSKQLSSPASGDPESVVGGSSFNDAFEVGSGTYVTEILPGEVVVFKTRIQYGQSGLFSLDGIDPDPAVLQSDEGAYGTYVPAVYGPDLSRMNSQELMGPYSFKVIGNKMVTTNVPVINEVPEVRYRNRWDSPRMFDDQSLGFSMGGYYYYALSLGDQSSLDGKPVKFKFSIKVSGDVSGEPVSTVSPIPPQDEGADRADGHGRWGLLAGGSALVLLGGGGAAYSLLRRR